MELYACVHKEGQSQVSPKILGTNENRHVKSTEPNERRENNNAVWKQKD